MIAVGDAENDGLPHYAPRALGDGEEVGAAPALCGLPVLVEVLPEPAEHVHAAPHVAQEALLRSPPQSSRMHSCAAQTSSVNTSTSSSKGDMRFQ